MIPNKLYIPSTTLNFNNIMASESISPAGFYSARGFGYNRFYKVPPNNLDKRIILYDKYPIFDISDAELENYPIVIEIDFTYKSESPIHEYKNGIYYAEETIYFNPFFTKIYFRNEEEKHRTISKIEQSLSTKMMPIYQNCIFVENSTIDSFKWADSEVTDTTEDFAKYISNDRLINKLKGFLYAYLLGANKSLPDEIIALKKCARELHNVLSSAITSFNSQASVRQDEEIKALYKEINNSFCKAEGLDKKLENLIDKKAKEYNCPNFLDMLEKEGLYEFWYQRQNPRLQYQIQAFDLSRFYKSTLDNNKYKSEKSVESKNYFDNYFTELEKAINKVTKYKNNYKNCSIDALPILQDRRRVASIQNNEFLPKLFNEYCAENWNGEEFTASRYDFADYGGKLFREELKDKWENSKHRLYINDLRNNFTSNTPFSLKSTEDLTLKSFAAFCQKGEDDISKLENYLIANEIGDFRISFALWGMIFGFASMPKTLTNELFISNDLNYITSVYKYIFKQIHGIELEGQIEEIKPSDYKTNPSKINEMAAIPQAPRKELKENQNNIDIDSKLISCKLKTEQLEQIREKYKNNYYLVNDNFFIAVKNIKGIGDKKLEKIKDALKNSIVKNKPEQKEATSFTKVTPQRCSEFYTDKTIFSSIESLLPDNDKTKKRFKEDLDWFQGNYRIHFKDKKGEMQNGCYWGKPTDNSSVIEKFQTYLEKRKNGNDSKTAWLKEFYFSVEIDQIIKELKKLYLQDER